MCQCFLKKKDNSGPPRICNLIEKVVVLGSEETIAIGFPNAHGSVSAGNSRPIYLNVYLTVLSI